MNKLVFPEIIGGILDQLNERDEQSPWVWSIHNQPLQQHTCYLLLNSFSVSFSKQRQQGTTKIVGVAVGVAQLVGNSVEEQVTT